VQARIAGKTESEITSKKDGIEREKVPVQFRRYQEERNHALKGTAIQRRRYKTPLRGVKTRSEE